jgi:hypothetical protein
VKFEAVGCQEIFEGLEIDFAIGIQQAKLALEGAGDVWVVVDFDPFDETVEAQAYGWVGNAVKARQVLQRTGGEHESLDKGEVFVAEAIDPTWFRVRILTDDCEHVSRPELNKRKIKVDNMICFIKVNIHFVNSLPVEAGCGLVRVWLGDVRQRTLGHAGGVQGCEVLHGRSATPY